MMNDETTQDYLARLVEEDKNNEWECERGVPGSSGIALPDAGLTELQLMELISHLRGTLEGTQFVDGVYDGMKPMVVPHWRLERINWEHDKTDKAWDVLMAFHNLTQKWKAEEEGNSDCDVEAGTVGCEGEEK